LGDAAQDRRHPRHHLSRGAVQPLGRTLVAEQGAPALRALFKGVDETLDGEWVPKEGKYYAFDLPDASGDFDTRHAALCKLKKAGVVLVDTYRGHFSRIYGDLPRATTEGVVFKRRSSVYAKQGRPSTGTRDWLKRRFLWDQ
jgi:ATP-dependent DNA ligase